MLSLFKMNRRTRVPAKVIARLKKRNRERPTSTGESTPAHCNRFKSTGKIKGKSRMKKVFVIACFIVIRYHRLFVEGEKKGKTKGNLAKRKKVNALTSEDRDTRPANRREEKPNRMDVHNRKQSTSSRIVPQRSTITSSVSYSCPLPNQQRAPRFCRERTQQQQETVPITTSPSTSSSQERPCVVRTDPSYHCPPLR